MAERKQPKALYVLFLTEMWERFGYYSMITLFVLYLTTELKLPDSQAFLIFGAYTSFAYLSTVAGGILADRLLGFRRCIIIGAAMMCAGYLLLQIHSSFFMYLSLAILVVGNGFFKPNVAGLLGTFYGEDDPRRDSGFTLFYMGINVGGFLASLVAGYVATTFSYAAAFAMAGIGKVICLVIFIGGGRYLEGHGMAPERAAPSPADQGAIPVAVYLAAGVVGSVAIVAFLMKHGLLAGEVLAAVGLLVTLYFIYEIFQEEPANRPKLVAMLVLILFAVVFFSVYMQSGLSVALFTERSVDLELLGHRVPPSDVQSLNPLFILLLAPVFSWAWLRMTRHGRGPSIPFKFALGMLFIGLAFLVLRMGGLATGAEHKVALGWMVLFFLLYTAGEMSLSPVGLAMVSAWAPKRLAGFAMGMWLLSISAASYISGIVAKIAAVPPGTGGAEQRQIYETAFTEFGVMALGVTLLLFALVPVLKRMIRR